MRPAFPRYRESNQKNSHFGTNSVRNSVIAGVISSQTPIAFAGYLDFVRNSERPQ